MKRINKTYIPVLAVGIILILTAIIFFVNRSVKRDLPEILKDGRLYVLVESGEHGFTRDSLKVYGFQYEIIKLFSNSIGAELVVINEENTKDGIEELTSGKCDVLVSLRPVENDTTLPVRYLMPIISTRLMLVQRKDSAGKSMISKQYELDNDTVMLMPNSPYSSRLLDLSDEMAATISLQEVDKESLDDMVKMVSENEYKYTVCPEYLAPRLLSRHSNVDISLPLSYKQDLSWCVNTYSVKLYESLNTFLDKFVLTPEYQRLYRQYFVNN